MEQNNFKIFQSGIHYLAIIYLSGIEIGLSDKLLWVIRKRNLSYELTRSFLEENEFIVWLPLVENDIKEFDQMFKDAIAQKLGTLNFDERNELHKSFPRKNLIKVALESKSEYWVDLGLKWLDAFSDKSSFEQCLHNIYEEKRFSQKIRHKSLKLLASIKR